MVGSDKWNPGIAKELCVTSSILILVPLTYHGYIIGGSKFIAGFLGQGNGLNYINDRLLAKFGRISSPKLIKNVRLLADLITIILYSPVYGNIQTTAQL